MLIMRECTLLADEVCWASDQDVAVTLCQIFKEALADSEQGPVVALEDGGGGHHQLGLRVNLRKLVKALTNPAPPNQARSESSTS